MLRVGLRLQSFKAQDPTCKALGRMKTTAGVCSNAFEGELEMKSVPLIRLHSESAPWIPKKSTTGGTLYRYYVRFG